MNTKETALKLAENQFKVFQLSRNSKIPLKGSHGYKDATNDINLINRTFSARNNLGLALSQNRLVLLDIDIRTHDQLSKIINHLKNRGYELPNTYAERTIKGGLHAFYRTNTPLPPTNKTVINLGGHLGVEIRTDGVIIAPSSINGHNYTPSNQNSLQDATEAPKWIYDELTETNDFNVTVGKQRAPTQKYYTGKKLDAIAKGVSNGNRNNWLTAVIGWLFGTGADPETVYQFAFMINENFISPPLNGSEVNTIYKSILRRLTN